MATTNIKRSTSASRLINYAEKRAVQKDGHNIQIDYAKTEFKQVREVFGNSGSTQAYAIVLVSISVLIFAFLFFSTLSGFGLKKIMSLTILKYQAPTWQVALGYVFKVFLALLFYFGGLILILSPILIYQKFLKFISTKYFGFGGKLKNFFLRN